jgi:hypothetical protein
LIVVFNLRFRNPLTVLYLHTEYTVHIYCGSTLVTRPVNINEMELRLFSANEQITKPPRRPVDRPTGVNDPTARERLSGQLHYPITDVLYDEHTRIATLASADKTHTHIR